MTDRPPMEGLVKNADGRWECPKCHYLSGDGWAQCEGSCPVAGSPWFGCEPAPVDPVSESDDIPF